MTTTPPSTSTGHPLWNPEAIAKLLRTCGQNALHGRQHGAWRLKGDGSLVTALDIANERLLRDELTRLIPGSRFIGEETLQSCTEDYLEQCFTGDCWIVDPIDGTAPFAHGFPLWAVSVGLMHDGQLVDGGVCMPSLNEMLLTGGTGILRAGSGDDRLRPFAPEPQPWSPGGMIELGQAVVRSCHLTLPNPLLATGSAVQAISSVILGDAMLYIGRFKLYDIAGLLPIMVRTGLRAMVPGHGELTPDVRGGAFELAPTDAHRWSLRATARIGWPQTLEQLPDELNDIP